MRFSQRIGKTSSTKLVQKEEVDDDLRNSLWNAVTIVYFQKVSFAEYGYDKTERCDLRDFVTLLWLHFFKQPIDQIPYQFSDTVEHLKRWFYRAQWFEILDFVEACSVNGPKGAKSDFIETCNSYLERENSAYRFVSGQLTEITSQEEIEAVENAIANESINSGARDHLLSALSLMNDKANPDYRNSIKESISAVESIARQISGDNKATLGQALKVLEKNGALHSALKSAFSSLYGYTNDAEGIRHSLMEEHSLTKADARFMLVSCSAFTNYLTELGAN